MSDNLLECKATTSKQASKTKPSGHRGFYPLEKLSKHFENQTQPLYRWNLELTFPGVSTNFYFNSFYFFCYPWLLMGGYMSTRMPSIGLLSVQSASIHFSSLASFSHYAILFVVFCHLTFHLGNDAQMWEKLGRGGQLWTVSVWADCQLLGCRVPL